MKVSHRLKIWKYAVWQHYEDLIDRDRQLNHLLSPLSEQILVNGLGGWDVSQIHEAYEKEPSKFGKGRPLPIESLLVEPSVTVKTGQSDVFTSRRA